MKLFELLDRVAETQQVEVILKDDETKMIEGEPASIRDMIMPRLNSGTVENIEANDDLLEVWVTPGGLKEG